MPSTDMRMPFAPTFQDFLNTVLSTRNGKVKIKPKGFIIVNDTNFEGKDVMCQQVAQNHNVIDDDRLHVPFDNDAVEFYTSTISWEVDNQDAPAFFSEVTEHTLGYGYSVAYVADGTYLSTDYEPIFLPDQTLVALIAPDGSIRAEDGTYLPDEQKGKYIRQPNPEPFSLAYYRVFYSPDKLPIWWKAVPLINAYTASLNDNKTSLDRFADSILTITGVDTRQKLSDDDLLNIGKSFVLAFQTGISPDGTQAPTPTAGFIAPPLNTEARESWSARIRKEVYSTLHIPDFDNIGGNVSTDSLKIYMWRTIQSARRYADYLLPDFQSIFTNVSYQVDLPTSKDNQALTLNNLNYLSTKTKIQELNPDWDDARVTEELSRLEAEKTAFTAE